MVAAKGNKQCKTSLINLARGVKLTKWDVLKILLENVKKITNDEMLLREKYGELKGVARVREMSKDYKDKDTLKDIFKKGKEGLTNAKRELTEVIVKEKLQQATKVRKSIRKEDHEIAEIRKQTLAEDIRVSVENTYCSKLYLTKLEA